VTEVAGGGDHYEAEELGERRDGISGREEVLVTEDGAVEEAEVALCGAPVAAG
jgi:hypothetical protein